jgi:formate dehydrogenase major subunit
VAKEINGFTVLNPGTSSASRGSRLSTFGNLLANGTTACGCWVYCGFWPEPSADLLAPQTGPLAGNRATKRVPVDNSASGIGLYSNWAWCWPLNRRILYNRASLRPLAAGGYVPWDDTRWILKYEYTNPAADTTTRWAAGGDVPDGAWYPDDYMPYIMQPDGAGHLFATTLLDGPLPEHYEPAESPLANHPFGAAHETHNPVVVYGSSAGANYWAQYGFPEVSAQDRTDFPHVGTTYRFAEHWQGGAMTRNLPWLAELQPDMICEMSEELATSLGVVAGDRVKVTTRRNTAQPVFAVAVVTRRFEPFTIMGQVTHQVGFVWHFGYRGIAQGSSANLLTAHVGDGNTRIPEFKAFLCKVEKA